MTKYLIILISLVFTNFSIFSQELDVDELLEKIERLEKNVSDLQKGKFDELDKTLSSGYISRNEQRLDNIETKTRANFGLIEEIENKIKQLDDKFSILNKEFQSRMLKIETELKNLNKKKLSDGERNQNVDTQNKRNLQNIKPENRSKEVEANKEISDTEIKKKYENAIKLLWANKFKRAELELLELKNINPEDLMPNIQYWLGEVYYANKNFEQAIIEFGEGFKSYPNSIKGPDNLLKLGLSFSNLDRKNDACNAFFELELKFKNAAKNVLERSQQERKKLDCPIE